jgi:spectinomycin phosphotransferase
LTDDHRRVLGEALKRIHTAQVPLELQRRIPKETFHPKWRESLKSFQRQIEKNSYADTTAAKLAEFMKLKQDEITHLVQRTEQLASELQTQPLEFVLCHTDFHGGNILVRMDGRLPILYIVDWANPLLAPKERDLMFIGGGIDEIWKSSREEAMFYEGYGETEIKLAALTFYRYERVIEDLAVICEQLLLMDEGGADRERSYGWFTSNFEPGSTIEIAEKTDKRLKTSLR